MWPVDAVIGENGAFYLSLEKTNKGFHQLKKTYLESVIIRKKNAQRLKTLERSIQKKFKGAHFASDQFCRQFDLAVDFCEDVPRWKDVEVEALIEHCKKSGAQAKLSSIHVNTWFGKYDKLTAVKKILKERYKIDFLDSKKSTHYAYVGDSPNDEVFFQNVNLSIGVANVMSFEAKLKYFPRFVTQRKSGDGFSELAHFILRATNNK
jgi:hydroxymethylpyrimidine pyrophosphatase-like HAD family hydrolase